MHQDKVFFRAGYEASDIKEVLVSDMVMSKETLLQ